MTTYEEARRCPKCEEPGEESGRRSLHSASLRGAELHIFACKNSRCQWFDTTWTVQRNPDGTIPEPTARREKQFLPVQESRAQRAVEALERQYELEQQPGAEVRHR